MQKINSNQNTIFSLFRDVLNNTSEGDLNTIAYIKRFIERIYGDPDFLHKLRQAPSSGRELALMIGAKIDPKGLSSIWDRPGDLPIRTDELGDSPLTKMWCNWVTTFADSNSLMCAHGETPRKNPRFNAWRSRQIHRCISQLGNHGKEFPHPIFTFELSLGCKVQCPFCGLNVGKFKQSFERNSKNTQLWREVLEAAVDMFGTASQTSVCYLRTEPFDNPAYLEFLKDFKDIIGELPQTTTAVPLRDIKVTKELLRLQNGFYSMQNRFSVLTTQMLRRIHNGFTPMELINVKLLMYHMPQLLKKARSGRIFVKDDNELMDETTIVCLAGFVVNMVEKTVELISPCPASERFPLGYRLHFKGKFQDANGFRACIEKAVSNCMPEYIENDKIVALRGDVKYEGSPEGIRFLSKFNKSTFSGKTFLWEMGDMVSTRQYTPGQIIGRLIENNADFFEVTGTLQSIFDRGLLDDSSTVLTQEN